MKEFLYIKSDLESKINDLLSKYNLKIYELINEEKSEFDSDIIRILLEDATDSDKTINFDSIVEINNKVSLLLDDLLKTDEPYLLEVSGAGIEKQIRNFEELKKAVDKYIFIKLNKHINSLDEIYGFLDNISEEDQELEIRYFIKGQKKKSKINWNQISFCRYAIKF